MKIKGSEFRIIWLFNFFFEAQTCIRRGKSQILKKQHFLIYYIVSILTAVFMWSQLKIGAWHHPSILIPVRDGAEKSPTHAASLCLTHSDSTCLPLPMSKQEQCLITAKWWSWLCCCLSRQAQVDWMRMACSDRMGFLFKLEISDVQTGTKKKVFRRF